MYFALFISYILQCTLLSFIFCIPGLCYFIRPLQKVYVVCSKIVKMVPVLEELEEILQFK